MSNLVSIGEILKQMAEGYDRSEDTPPCGEDELEQWLRLIFEDQSNTSNFMFPNEGYLKQYLLGIESKSWIEVRHLIKKFLISSGSLGSDENILSRIISLNKRNSYKNDDEQEAEFISRLKEYEEGNDFGLYAPPPWEGITWVLDLLPTRPRLVLQVLEAYLSAHAQFLPDGRISGLLDAMEVIRAKCMKQPKSWKEKIQLLLQESPEQTANFGDGWFQAAFLLALLVMGTTSSPSTNSTPVISFGN